MTVNSMITQRPSNTVLKLIQAVLTLYRMAFRAYTKSYPIQYEKQWHRTGTNHLHTLNPVLERLAQSSLYYITTVSVDSSPLLIHFRYGSDICHVHTAPCCHTEPIRYEMLHFRDRCGASSLLCNRNCNEITPFLSVKKAYQVSAVLFSCRRKSQYLVQCEHSLKK